MAAYLLSSFYVEHLTLVEWLKHIFSPALRELIYELIKLSSSSVWAVRSLVLLSSDLVYRSSFWLAIWNLL